MWYESIEIDGADEFSKEEFESVSWEMRKRARAFRGALEEEYEQEYEKEKQRTYEQVMYGGPEWDVYKLRDEYALYDLALPPRDWDKDELRRELARTAIEEDVPLPDHEAEAMYIRMRRYELLGYLWARFLKHGISAFLKEEEDYFTGS